jgi:acyl-CoA reductase-like NAD-dependent aldehyde dehydrogenase
MIHIAFIKVTNTFSKGGQSCIAGNKILVYESIYDEIDKRTVAFANGIKFGDPLYYEAQQDS